MSPIIPSDLPDHTKSALAQLPIRGKPSAFTDSDMFRCLYEVVIKAECVEAS
jgi:hypothetical protein